MATTQGQGSIPLVELPNGYQVVFEAISPTTGAAVNGVVVGTITLTVDAPIALPAEDIQLLPPVLTAEQT